MIKVTMPQQNFGTGLMQGFQAGASVTPTPQELQEARLRQQLLQGQITNIPVQNQIDQAKLALMQQQAKTAAQNTLQAKIAYIQSLSGQNNNQAPSDYSMTPEFQAAMSQSPQASSLNNLLSGQPSASSMDIQNPLNSYNPQIPTPSPLPQEMMQTNQPAQPNTSNQLQNTPSPTIGGLTPNDLINALIKKTFGYPVTDPILEARRKEQIYASQAAQRGKIEQLVHLANGPSSELTRLGLSDTPETREGIAKQIYQSLPPRQKNQMVSSPDFISHFNQQIKPLMEKFAQDLGSGGINGLYKLNMSKVDNLMGKNKGLYDEYQNIKRLIQASVSDYRSGLGDNATNYQTKFIDNILSPNFTTMSIGGQLDSLNNLLRYSDIAVKDAIKNSPLIQVKNHLPYEEPDYFETGTTILHTPDGRYITIPTTQINEFLKQGYKKIY